MKIKSLLSIAMLGLLVTACNDDMNDVQVQVPEQGKMPFVATISAKSIDSALTRSTIVDNGNGTISNAWEVGDKIHIGYLVNKDATEDEKQDPSNWGEFVATVSSVSTEGAATITANLDNSLADGEELYVVYPASAAMGPYRYIKNEIIIDQDGTLSPDRDVETAITTLKVEDGVASFAETLSLVPFFDIYKFNLFDQSGEPLKVKKFSIKSSGQSRTRVVTLNSAAAEFYVTLNKMSGSELNFEATSENGDYYVATAKATTKVRPGQSIVDFPAKYYTATVTMEAKSVDPALKEPLTIEPCYNDVTVTISNPLGLTIKYLLTGGTLADVNGTSIDIPVKLGEKLQLFGDNAAYAKKTEDGIVFTNILFSNDCEVYGNIMSLINSEYFATEKILTKEHTFEKLFQSNDHLSIGSNPLILPATELTESCYNSMFSGCTLLRTAPALPATTLAEFCYDSMFNGCTQLGTAPELPATILVKGCYQYMFRNCISMTTAPVLPATTLEEACYFGMFSSCVYLTTAPELPATTLAKACYGAMFNGCVNLTTAPLLPATTLAPTCYFMMFQMCSSLTSVTCLATDISADSCTTLWLMSVSETGTFYRKAGVEWPISNYTGIPVGWTVKDYEG